MISFDPNQNSVLNYFGHLHFHSLLNPIFGSLAVWFSKSFSFALGSFLSSSYFFFYISWNVTHWSCLVPSVLIFMCLRQDHIYSSLKEITLWKKKKKSIILCPTKISWPGSCLLSSSILSYNQIRCIPVYAFDGLKALRLLWVANFIFKCCSRFNIHTLPVAC